MMRLCEKLYAGTVPLERNLPELIDMAENTLDLDEHRRAHTLIRAGARTPTSISCAPAATG